MRKELVFYATIWGELIVDCVAGGFVEHEVPDLQTTISYDVLGDLNGGNFLAFVLPKLNPRGAIQEYNAWLDL